MQVQHSAVYRLFCVLTWLATYKTVALITIRTTAIGHMIRINTDCILGTWIMHITWMQATLLDARLGYTTIRVIRALDWQGERKITIRSQ